MKKKLVLRIALCSVAAALFVIFDMLSIKAGPYKITMSGLPVIIIAIMFGPIEGMITGFVGAFIGQLLSEYGLTPTTILWVLPAVVRGLFVGYFAQKVDLVDKNQFMVIVIVTSSLIVTMLNTIVMYIDSVIYGYYSYAYIFGALITRIVSGLLTSIVYSLLTPRIIKPLLKVKK